MQIRRENTVPNDIANAVMVAGEANSAGHSKGDFEAMARRRFQDPVPKREGNFWYLLYWQDSFNEGVRTRKRQRVKLAPATMPEREAKKIAAEILRPMNQGLISVGSAVTFNEYVDSEYMPSTLPQLSSSTQDC